MQGDVERETVEGLKDTVSCLREVETYFWPAVEIASNRAGIIQHPSGMIENSGWGSVSFGSWLDGR
jgi:hypothetical protein